MSREYRKKVEKDYEYAIEKILDDAPAYLSDFYHWMHGGKREISTQHAYIVDVMAFLKYEQSVLASSVPEDLSEFPLNVLCSLTIKDMNEYREYMHDKLELSNASIKKRFAAISMLYKYLNIDGITNQNPMQFFELPVINKHKIVKLDANLSNRLLEGILRNDTYLAEMEEKQVPLPIPENVWLKREPLVLRNYAICALFLGSGLRVSELIGLDLNDISFYNQSIRIIAKGGDETEVYFGDDTAAALRMYLYGIDTADILQASEYFAEGSVQWCRDHANSMNFEEQMKQEYPDMPQQFYNGLLLLSSSERRKKREDFHPKRNTNAIFITTRGSRMSVRMVQVMIKEMVQTYLPEYDDKDIFSPHKLRATCATRILTQTGDIQLSSTQLNHKGIEVTAAFYAELQRGKQKEKIQKLDLHDW